MCEKSFQMEEEPPGADVLCTGRLSSEHQVSSERGLQRQGRALLRLARIGPSFLRRQPVYYGYCPLNTAMNGRTSGGMHR